MSERHIQDGSGSGTPGCRTDTAVVSLLIWTAFGLVAVATLASPAQARQFRTASAAEEAEVPGGRTVDRSPLSKGEYTDCRPTTTPLVFDGGYRVSMCYETAQGRVGEAQAGIWASGQSGLLWFFDRDNAEVLVKVLDGCSSNRHRWVFVAPVTDVAFNLYVTSSGGREWTHRNPLGQTAVTRSDTSAFVCATDDDAVRTSLATGEGPELVTGQNVVASPLSKGEYTDCRPTTAPLVFDGTYQVSLCYETEAGVIGEARGGLWASTQSGLLWFFSRDNAEVLVKVLDGCSHNGSRWIFVAPVTDVAFNLHVRSVGGRQWTHRNRLGETAATRSDTSAFDCATDDGVLETVSVSPASAEEGDVVEFTVRQSGPAGTDTMLGWSTSGGTATSGVDFRAVKAGTLRIAAGDTTGTLRVSTVEDTLVEGNETFTVTLTGTMLPPGVNLGTTEATGTIVDEDAEPVYIDIPDSNLRSAIEDALDLASGAPITQAGLESLTRLEAPEAGIRNLTGLEFATGLTELLLGLNEIRDVSPLAGLTKLTYLGLGLNEIRDVSPLAGLTKLTALGLGYNEITEASPLAGLTNLTNLYLQYNEIRDVSFLAGFTNLGDLHLSGNEIRDVSFLAGLTNLRGLGLTFAAITEVSPLAGLINLRTLGLAVNEITEVSPLAGLRNLTRLDLGFNEIRDVSPLAGLTKLRTLGLHANPLDRTSLEVHVSAFRRRGADVQFVSYGKGVSKGEFDIEPVFLGDGWSSWPGRVHQRLIELAARRWAVVLRDDLADHTFSQGRSGMCGENSWEIPPGERIDDLRVYVSTFDGGPGDPVGFGGPSLLRDSGFPISGCIVLDLKRGNTPVVASHELGHVLGIGTLQNWEDFVRTSGDPHFGGPLAIAAFEDAGGRGYSGAKVPLQGVFDTTHWRVPVLQSELMGPSGGGLLSAITVQALADMGYGVDVSQADEYTLPGTAAAPNSGGTFRTGIRKRSPIGAGWGSALGNLGFDRESAGETGWLLGDDGAALLEPAPFCGVRGASEPLPVVGR